MADRTLMGPHEPAFQERDDKMHSGEQFGGRLLLTLQDCDLVDAAFGLEAAIAPPPIRMDRAAGGNGIEDKRVQTFSRSIRYQAKADSPDAPHGARGLKLRTGRTSRLHGGAPHKR